MKGFKVFNQRIDFLSFDETLFLSQKAVLEKEKSLFFAMNVHILKLLSKDRKFKEKHERKASLIFTDGMPLIFLSKFKKFSNGELKERISGTDLAEQILISKEHKVFLLGTSETILKEVAKKYSVCGFYSPPFQEKWSEKEDQKIINLINKSKANTLLVAVGPLKQEKWLINNFSKLKTVYLGMGIGSALDILSGKKRRAPKLMRDFYLEWLWRLILEPKRLFKRYLGDFLFLIRLFFHD